MFFDHPVYKRAYLHHEIQEVCHTFCRELELPEPIIQVVLKKTQTQITVKLGSSSECTVAKLQEYRLFEMLKTVLESKNLWDSELEWILMVKLK